MSSFWSRYRPSWSTSSIWLTVPEAWAESCPRLWPCWRKSFELELFAKQVVAEPGKVLVHHSMVLAGSRDRMPHAREDEQLYGRRFISFKSAIELHRIRQRYASILEAPCWIVRIGVFAFARLLIGAART